MTNLTNVLEEVLTGEVKAIAFYKIASIISRDSQARMIFCDLMRIKGKYIEELISKVTETSLSEEWDANHLGKFVSTISTTFGENIASIIHRRIMKEILESARDMQAKARKNYEILEAESKAKELKNFFSNMVDEENFYIKQMDFLLLNLKIK
jgi:hypothetical protein